MDSSREVYLVAPSQLRDAFLVLLKSVPRVKPLVYPNNIEFLLEEASMNLPDIAVLFFTDDAQAADNSRVTVEQIRDLKSASPGTFCIVFIEFPRQRDAVNAAGADMTLLEGISSTRFSETIKALVAEQTGTP